MSELGLPLETRCAFGFHSDQLSDDVPGVHVNGADCHDLLTVVFGQVAD